MITPAVHFSYTHDIEAVSCDEMLVDCTDLLSSTGATPLEFASLLRQEIYEKTKCTASAGLGKFWRGSDKHGFYDILRTIFSFPPYNKTFLFTH